MRAESKQKLSATTQRQAVESGRLWGKEYAYASEMHRLAKHVEAHGEPNLRHPEETASAVFFGIINPDPGWGDQGRINEVFDETHAEYSLHYVESFTAGACEMLRESDLMPEM